MRDSKVDRAVTKLGSQRTFAGYSRFVLAGTNGEGPASGLPASFKDMLVGMDAAPAWILSGKLHTLLPPRCQTCTGKAILDDSGSQCMYAAFGDANNCAGIGKG